MDTIQAHVELMHNALPARVIEAGGRFFAVKGPDENPIIFSIGTDGHLYLLRKKPEDRENVQVDLSKAFGVPDEHVVHSVAVTQDTLMKVFIVFASGVSSGKSDIRIVKPMNAGDILTWTSTSNLSSLVMSGKGKDLRVNKLCLGASAQGLSNSAYPPIFVNFREVGRSTFDFHPVIVDETTTKWTLDQDFQLPINADSILDLRAATVDGQRSVFVLSREVGVNTLPQLRCLSLFESGGTITLQNVVQNCPEAATRLSSLSCADGNDDILVVGGGLFHRKGAECLLDSKTQGPWNILSTEPAYAKPEQLLVAQAGDQFSVWVQSAEQDDYYQEYSRKGSAAPQELRPIVPLLLRKAGGGTFAPIRTSGGQQQLLVIGMKDSQQILTILSQNATTRLWDTSPVTVPALKDITEFVSYTSRVGVKDSDGVPKQDIDLCISASIPTEVIVNGRRIAVEKVAKIVNTDKAGTVTIIMPGTKDAPPVDCPIITLEPAKGSKNTYNGPSLKINAAQKMIDATEKLSSVDELKKLRQNGDIRSDLSDDDLAKAAKAFGDLKEASSSVNENGEVQHKDSSPHGPAPSHSSFQVSNLVVTDIAGSFQNAADDFWTLIKTNFDKMVKWGIEKVKGGWAFVCELASGVYRLVVKTISHIVQAAIKVFEFLKMAIDKIIKFIGFLFQWEDIVQTKNVFVNLTTQALIFGSDNLGLLQQATDSFCKDMQDMVQNMKTRPLPAKLAGVKAGKETAKEKSNEGKDKAKQDDMDSPGTTFGHYQMQHGGKSVESQQTGSGTPVDGMEAVWAEVQGLVDHLFSNFSKLFKSTDKPIEEVIKDMGLDLLTDIIGVTGKVISALIGLLRDLILRVADAMNKEITIPVLSALYEKISHAPLTLLDLVCLLMAIPATIGYKLFVGESPTKISGIDYLTKPNIYLSQLKQKLHKDPAPVFQQKTMMLSALTAPDATSVAKSGPNIHSPMLSAPKAHVHMQMHMQTTSKVDWNAKIREAQLNKDVTVVDKLAAYGAPIGSMLWFNFYTTPSWYKPDTGANTDDLGFIADVFIWAIQYKRIGPSEVPGFKWRLATWLIGFFNPYANECKTKAARAGFRFWCGVLQLVTSIGNYVTLFQNDIDVDIYTLVEDFVIMIGDLCAAAADQQSGSNPYVVGAAWIMKNAGFIMRVAKTERTGYQSGMTIKP